ncbi:ABC transporter ATP-binding protein [Aeropyrum camini]|uniref:ABC-type multidrug transport system ATPase n=1 Tax=Aeropyrum camini SY1 = JCM 12091 TaxID=1198449 RepID=U3TCW5_9CREN|nr:ABC transporter ATP-binding protein [Aeropyrum camini]BAN90266.1 ABC-type multidrug transport system ATPase [Aeropyrum camini SY1 = JCM 12091]
MGAAEPAVEVRSIWKRLGGRWVLRDVSLTVPRGVVYGVVGPNGAGKTTLFRVILGLYRAERGSVRLLGEHVERAGPGLFRRVAYLPEDGEPYRNMTGLEFLRLYASIYGVEEPEGYLEEASRLSGLGERLGDRVRSYSKGMRRRLLVAAMLALKPSLAVLDEPTAGLDPVYSVGIRRLLGEYSSRHGVTVLLSSHNMYEVESVCSEIAMISRGGIVYTGTPRGAVEKTGAANLEEAYVALVSGGGGG